MNKTTIGAVVAAVIISAASLGFGIGAIQDANHTGSRVTTTDGQITSLENQVSKLQTQLNAASEADKNAINAHEGICYNVNYSDGDGVDWVSSVAITPPNVDNGVYECENGATYVSVTPTAANQLVG